MRSAELSARPSKREPGSSIEPSPSIPHSTLRIPPLGRAGGRRSGAGRGWTSRDVTPISSRSRKTGRSMVRKVVTTPVDPPSRCSRRSMPSLFQSTFSSMEPRSATNARSKRRGARIALVTTKGSKTCCGCGARPGGALRPRPRSPVAARSRGRCRGVAERTGPEECRGWAGRGRTRVARSARSRPLPKPGRRPLFAFRHDSRAPPRCGPARRAPDIPIAAPRSPFRFRNSAGSRHAKRIYAPGLHASRTARAGSAGRGVGTGV